ncbi:XrtA system polysaccharide chain length determinant [Psychromonas ossibalaenae]|uniref:XrtA system polysaccharide chain length determinant n=1 Tax=Psychromonas ossibalaenae TaxID=444922 RepID=UPI00036282EC|nr:XrtA system polysaccharide chain length determinant [Psychromonas ossibalaenae]
MEHTDILKYFVTAWREICQRKFKTAFIITLLSFAVMAIGIFKPSVFKSEVTIYADTQNVIKPLLGKQTEVTRVKQNRTDQVRDIIYSPRQLTKVMNKIYGKNAFPEGTDKENKLTELRQKLSIESISGNYIRVSYEDDTADKTFRLLNEVVLLFIEDSANTKREESRSAFNFIEQQVDSYKKQLLLAEQRLKNFKSTHLDGTESEVETRISTIRADIEDMKIQKMESLTRIASFKKQLSSQDKFSAKDYEAALYHTRLKELQQELANLLLVYKDDYPSVIDLRYQITDLRETIEELNSAEKTQSDNGAEFNPLYKEISSKLSSAQVEHTTINNRLNAFKALLAEAYDRRKRIANNQAELAELNRDNSVTKVLYEDMLANKEKARLSMVLDIEGQGVNYKIQEPATYPTTASGPRFLHFVIAGPILSFLLLIIIFIIKGSLDGKVRFSSQLSSFEGVPLLASISHSMNHSEIQKRRIHNITLMFYMLFAMALYAGAAFMYKYDIPASQLLTLWS